MAQVNLNIIKIVFIIFITILIVGCGDRNTSTVEKSLVGHWATGDRRAHYYFSRSSHTIVINYGDEDSWNYSILEKDENKGWIKIKVEKGVIYWVLDLYFSPDRKSLSVEREDFFSLKGFITKSKWDYIDNKKRP